MKKLIIALIALSTVGFANYYHLPVQCHQAISCAVDGSSVFLEDGSEWTVYPDDRYIVMHWDQQDMLNISLNSSFFPASEFYISNPRTGEYIRVDMKLGPFYDNLYTKRVVGIDYLYGEVCIEDGSGYQTWWVVESSDIPLLRQWNVNDGIIVGSNDNWYSGFFSSCDAILHVVEHDITVRAREH
ncbi:MAG: hypothetical protein SP1CHLAM54_07380 [Chlamydiia bacterium]|nr:hypothetical protein [Chlamydiia bacterium]MCH9615644.1 hypothetical protein [Chlamydiia bacterium]MCH9628953.1 hypothetical protein [Chlamydiia bacterium]